MSIGKALPVLAMILMISNPVNSLEYFTYININLNHNSSLEL